MNVTSSQSRVHGNKKTVWDFCQNDVNNHMVMFLDRMISNNEKKNNKKYMQIKKLKIISTKVNCTVTHRNFNTHTFANSYTTHLHTLAQ